jgi:hypothetical protein
VSSVTPGSGIPSGLVTFYDGPINTGVVLGTGFLVGGTFSISVSNLAAGSHAINVQYAGDPNYLTNVGSLNYTVSAATTNSNVTASANPALVGTPVFFTATVTAQLPAVGTPIGSVIWSVDGIQQGQPVPLNSNGQATFASSWTAVGTHTITAGYVGNGNFTNSVGSLSEVVNSKSTTRIQTSTNPTVFGQPVTFTATVTGLTAGVGTPGGPVVFVIDNVPTAPVQLDQNGQATYTTTALSVGPHSVSANYGGSIYFFPSTSTNLNQTVNKAQTATAVTGPGGPIVFGQSVTYTATVQPVAPGAGTLTGAVTFFLDGVAQTTVPISGTQAAWTPSTPLSVGSHKIVAVYGTDPSFSGSTSAVLTQLVTRAGTTTTVSSSSNPSFAGQLVIFTATVTPQAVGQVQPTGQVQFLVNGALKATAALDSTGHATFTTGTLAVGSYTITATYLGNVNSAPSTAQAITQTVQTTGTAADTTTIGSSLNPAVFGQAVTFTATVTPANPALGTLNGFVTFLLNGKAQTTIPISNGQASWTPTSLAVGSYKVTAQYSGDLVYATSTTATPVVETITKVGTTSTVVSTAPTAIIGEPVTYTATVTGQGGATATPTGSVTFLVDGKARFTGKLDASGQATWTTSYGAVGTHRITVQYSGNVNYAKSNSNATPLKQVVIKSGTAGSSVVLSSSGSPSQLGQSVTFTADVFAANPANGTPTGQVIFLVDGKAFATVNVTSGKAVWTTSHLPSGTHNIVAVYSGDPTFANARSGPVVQTVQNNARPVSLTATATQNADGSYTLTAVARDSFGNQVTNFNFQGSVLIVSGPATGALTGQVMVNFVNGVAVFNGVNTSIPGTYLVDIGADGLASGNLTLNTGGRER